MPPGESQILATAGHNKAWFRARRHTGCSYKTQICFQRTLSEPSPHVPTPGHCPASPACCHVLRGHSAPEGSIVGRFYNSFFLNPTHTRHRRKSLEHQPTSRIDSGGQVRKPKSNKECEAPWGRGRVAVSTGTCGVTQRLVPGPGDTTHFGCRTRWAGRVSSRQTSETPVRSVVLRLMRWRHWGPSKTAEALLLFPERRPVQPSYKGVPLTAAADQHRDKCYGRVSAGQHVGNDCVVSLSLGNIPPGGSGTGGGRLFLSSADTERPCGCFIAVEPDTSCHPGWKMHCRSKHWIFQNMSSSGVRGGMEESHS